jgi:alpha-ribazole phosphatase
VRLRIALIRHAHDSGGRLRGMADKPLTEKDSNFLRRKALRGVYPRAELVFSSGLARCVQTADIIYPNVPKVLLRDFRAPDYGSFEGLNAKKLMQREDFVKWASSCALESYPGGEDPYAVTARSVGAFVGVAMEMAAKGLTTSAIISHRQVIISVLQRFQIPRSRYTHWEIPHGGGYLLIYDTLSGQLSTERRL